MRSIKYLLALAGMAVHTFSMSGCRGLTQCHRSDDLAVVPSYRRLPPPEEAKTIKIATHCHRPVEISKAKWKQIIGMLGRMRLIGNEILDVQYELGVKGVENLEVQTRHEYLYFQRESGKSEWVCLGRGSVNADSF